MRRGMRCAGVLLVATMAMAGCSSGDEPEAAPEEPTASAASSETPEPEPEPQPVDPCTLLSAEDLEAAGVRADLEKSNRALLPDSRTATCVVPHPKDGWGIYFGFSSAAA